MLGWAAEDCKCAVLASESSQSRRTVVTTNESPGVCSKHSTIGGLEWRKPNRGVHSESGRINQIEIRWACEEDVNVNSG